MKIKKYHSHRHVEAASFFAQEADEIEKRYHEDEKDREVHGFPRRDRHRAFVIGSVINSFAHVDAAINEFYDTLMDIAEGADLEDLNPNADIDTQFLRLLDRLDSISRRDHTRRSTLKKYQFLLAYADKEPFDRGQSTFQDIDSVRVLRNYFIHYVPDWRDSDSGLQLTGADKRLSELEGQFDTNPLVDDYAPFFPDKCLSYGCAKWAFNSSIMFIEEFYDKMGMRPATRDMPDHVQLEG